jgi:signal transduction histidine kinase
VVLAALVDEAGEAVRSPDRPFSVVNQVPPALLIEADRNQFFRVLANLLRNAADAGARSGVVSAGVEHGLATIDIADDGPGLPDAVRATLFRPFVHSTRHDGAGLGMAIARDLVLAHGGEITLASTGPEGTVFRLTLRVAGPCDVKQQDHREVVKEQDHREVKEGEARDREANERTADNGAARAPGIARAAGADV